ncbi:hypothetical protein [Streptomyces sp. NBC_01768]|uniref:hypothetical protein n=1 Tax=Streptomyces sp. NBC_01768 TaxID=2975938 RepID=UPI002DDB5B65|nr:hypothetical protein [Streptomyces sp. NBC_01768]WSC32309.1 hypothetical protein OG902_39620 [Streptomyces sp. NBC_01768]
MHSAYFTLRDREYGLRHNLLGRRFGAVKLPNRGRHEPEITDPYNQAVFYFHNRITESGSMYFATRTPGHADITVRELVILYPPRAGSAKFSASRACGRGPRPPEPSATRSARSATSSSRPASTNRRPRDAAALRTRAD